MMSPVRLGGRALVSLGWVLLGGAMATGCGPSPVCLTVRPDDALNERRPAYLLVRNVDSKTFLEETYDTAAAKVMDPDDSVLESAVVFPGTRQALQVSPPKKGQIAVYVFFYRPQGDWKALLPSVTGAFDVVLEGSRLRVEKK
ncbi:hypothetical protein WME95_31600 [Sorangium sp. So ce327]|jgi:hypothetical protein|uniref:hypothetical protein n=1 Tax=Sorangium sp. So ce327 TaxID=3133301 RepID=UPI003F635B52